MADLTPLDPVVALRRRSNTFKAMLADTADLLELLKYQGEEDRKAAEAQAEAIRTILEGS